MSEQPNVKAMLAAILVFVCLPALAILITHRDHLSVQTLDPVPPTAINPSRKFARYYEVEEAPGYNAHINYQWIEPYTEDKYPQTFTLWGAENVVLLNSLRYKAAEKVSRDRRCDEVIAPEWSEQESLIPFRPVIFVDCSNTVRFYLSYGR